MAPTRTVTLFCWILDVSNQAFSISIEDSRTVDDLKKAILKENPAAFANVDAFELTLWKESISIDKSLKEKVTQRRQRHFLDEDALLEADTLSDIFPHPEPTKRTLHIVVRSPRVGLSLPRSSIFTLNCWVLLEGADRVFPVEIAKEKSIGAVKDAIKDKKQQRLHDIDADALTLWKVSIPPEDRQTVLEGCEHPDKINGAQKLDPTMKLSKVFTEPVDEHLHIIVKCPDPEKDALEEERRDDVSALNKRFENVMSCILKADAPADSAKSSKYTKSQINYSIYDGRYKADKPRTSVSLPVQLFHPAFGHFLDDMKNNGVPVPDDIIRQTTEYMKAASAIYETEAKRRVVLTPLLCRVLGVDIQMIRNEDETNPDGIVEVAKNEARSLLLLKEDKNEFGDGGSDPSTQAGLSAGRCWAQSRFKRVRNATGCPTFLIASAGPWIAILGAVITDAVIVQRLTDCVWVGLDSVLNEPHITHVARIFHALKASLEKLNSYYDGQHPIGDLPADSRYFPSITAYPHNDRLVEFEYIGFLENSLDCTTLRARTKAGQDIVVKFVERYGEKAHRLLADADLAPKLLYCGSPQLNSDQPSYRSISLVVMEYVDGETLAVAKPKMKQGTIETVRSGVQHALELLHSHGLVFGDLRLPNILITMDGYVKLIDFNWAGEDGQAKYPPLISQDITWPEGVKAVAMMRRQHDIAMLQNLF